MGLKRERSGRVRHQFESMSTDVPIHYTNNTNSSVNRSGSGADNIQNEASDPPDASLSQSSTDSATADVILESVGKNIASSLDNVSRAIIESTKILANKMSVPCDRSEKLFTSLQALDLSREYLIECYYFLAKHETAANKFLGIPQQFRKEMLTRIMNAVSVSK